MQVKTHCLWVYGLKSTIMTCGFVGLSPLVPCGVSTRLSCLMGMGNLPNTIWFWKEWTYTSQHSWSGICRPEPIGVLWICLHKWTHGMIMHELSCPNKIVSKVTCPQRVDEIQIGDFSWCWLLILCKEILYNDFLLLIMIMAFCDSFLAIAY